MGADFRMPEGAALDDDVWTQVFRRPPPGGPRPALFLDRDGVVIEEVGYISRADDVRLIAGAAATIAAANAGDVPVVVVSNQSGIGRGLFGWPEFAAVQARMIERLAAGDARIDAVLACPHHRAARPPLDVADHPARKPAPGMLLAAAGLLDLDLAGSWIVGDRAQDLAAGRNAGLRGGVHVATGHGAEPGEREAALALAAAGFEVRVAESLGAAAAVLPLVA